MERREYRSVSMKYEGDVKAAFPVGLEGLFRLGGDLSGEVVAIGVGPQTKHWKCSQGRSENRVFILF